MHYATATKAVNHGLPCVEVGFVGVAVKQQAAPGGTGLGATAITQVGVGEKFGILIKGTVYVANLISAVKGSPVYIVAATNLLTLTSNSGANPKFGRVEAIAGERGVGTGQMRVDMDAKDSF
jgi:hypothetical protein